MLSQKLVTRVKEVLSRVAEVYYSAGLNVLPTWSWKKIPAVRKGEGYEKWLVRRMTREEFESFTLARIRDTKEFRNVLGIAIVNGIGGVVTIDYDVAKNGSPEIEERVRRLVREFGSFVYIERRVGADGSKYGVHVVLRVPNPRELDVRVEHPYSGEITVRTNGITVVAPSIYAPRSRISQYVKLSFVDISTTYYDKDLSVLKEILLVLGVTKIDVGKGAPARIGSGFRGVRIGLRMGREIDSVEKALRLLAEVGKVLGCVGFVKVVEGIARGEWFVEYRILREVVNVNHTRSTWTIIENHIFRTLAEAGVREEIVWQVANLIRSLEEEFLKRNGVSDAAVYDHIYENLENNVEQALKFSEHGHEPSGACIYRLLDLCPNPCNSTFLTKLFSNPQSLKIALMRVVNGV